MNTLDQDFARFKAEGAELAGNLGDFQQRAGAYFQLYRHSGGNFVFPLIAAHGALWGAGHMRRGMAVSHLTARLLRMSERKNAEKIALVTDFTDTLKDINRQVLIMTYTAYQMTRHHPDDPALENYISASLIAPLAMCHAARRGGWTLNDQQRRALFEAAFRWEQDSVVGPMIDAAIPKFEWPLIRALSLRPPIGFSYFGPLQWLWFRNFANRQERIRHGLRAYDIAIRKGLAHVEERLTAYQPPTETRKLLPSCGICAAG